MHSPPLAYSLNERLLEHIHAGNYKETLTCLRKGARATFVSNACGRTPVGTAALMGATKILELLIQWCEDPDLIYQATVAKTTEREVDTTPEGMDSLEWEDEFNIDNAKYTANSLVLEGDTSLYYYYAKTFERTGALISSLDDQPSCLKRSKPRQHDPHGFDALSMTPLHYAAACGHLKCVRILLEHGAPVDAVNADGYTPLLVSTECNEVTRLLLKSGANANLKTFNSGETALHLAIRNRCTTVARTILTSKANVNTNETDDIDQSPLMCAVACGLNDIASALIEDGVRINLQDKEGHTAFYYAVIQNNLRIATQLLTCGARRITSHYLLHHCVNYNYQQMAELLINHGESLNVRNKEGVTPILLAILGQKHEMLDFLLHAAMLQTQKGFPVVDRIDNNLIIAVQYTETLQEFRPIARLLFYYSDGHWMNASSSGICHEPYCQTPLARAIMLHKFDIAEFLLKEGVSISHTCRDHVISYIRGVAPYGSPELAQLLVHTGFKFPPLRTSVHQTWRPPCQLLQDCLLQLYEKPLTLKSLARIVIRQEMTKTLYAKFRDIGRYLGTKQESALSRTIKELEIPTVLKTFLNEFDDCPTVMHTCKSNSTLQRFSDQTNGDNQQAQL